MIGIQFLLLLFSCCYLSSAASVSAATAAPAKPDLFPTWSATVAMVVEVGGIALDMAGSMYFDTGNCFAQVWAVYFCFFLVCKVCWSFGEF